ncbi:MAG: cyclic nucleotide-binding domain-containing protein [Candidatus Gracilibacteria bacterium]|nr:cyclic nucleotide-binding domain-containing protein [Candidatus Gracilibacteria bacterium]
MEKLHELKIFTGIDRDILDNLLNNLQKEKFLSDQIILNEGDETNGKAYIIISGEVDIIINGEKISSLQEGDIFGEIALLNEEDRTATVIAKTDLELLVITQDAILEIMSEDNSLNKEIMRRVQENIENNR